jgi:hypothetical protein
VTSEISQRLKSAFEAAAIAKLNKYGTIMITALNYLEATSMDLVQSLNGGP